MSLTPLELQDKFSRLGELLGKIKSDEEHVKAVQETIKSEKTEIKSLYAELGITNRRQRKIVEKKPRKPRSDKGTKLDTPADNEPEKTREEMEAEARATAICPICQKLLKDCTCQISKEAAEKYKKLARK